LIFKKLRGHIAKKVKGHGLKNLNLDITAVFFDDNFVYYEIMSRGFLCTGKRNTQRVERKHLMFCAWLKCLVCRSICC